jgi:hypothetical protein
MGVMQHPIAQEIVKALFPQLDVKQIALNKGHIWEIEPFLEGIRHRYGPLAQIDPQHFSIRNGQQCSELPRAASHVQDANARGHLPV